MLIATAAAVTVGGQAFETADTLILGPVGGAAATQGTGLAISIAALNPVKSLELTQAGNMTLGAVGEAQLALQPDGLINATSWNIAASGTGTFVGLTTSAQANLNAGVAVTGTGSFSGLATFNGGINVSGAATFTGSVTIGGTLTYEDVTNIDSVGMITARAGVNVTGGQISGNGGGLTGVSTNFVSAVGIQSAGTVIGVGITQLNFIGAGNTFAVSGTTVAVSIAGGGGGGGAFTTSVTGVQTSSVIVGIGTTTTDDADLQGIGNTAKGLYISNGMMIMDNTVHGNHYIGTNFNGLMVGPVNINGTISIDGNYVVV